jgi:signal transduction histidine kinase
MKRREKSLVEAVKWLILLRLLLTTVFFSIGHLIFAIEKTNFYFLIAFVYLISALYSIWLYSNRGIRILVMVQLAVDVLLETIIIQWTGSIESVFTILYVLTILSAGVIISGKAGIITAVFIGLSYITANVLHSLHIWSFFNVSEAAVDRSINIIVYTSYVHIVTYVLISILLASLMRRISQMENVVRLKEHLALVGEVSAEIAHEIRNPLAAISGSVELLDERLRSRLSQDEKNLINAIVDESGRMSRIFDEFLDYTKLSRGEFVVVNIGELLDQVIFVLESNKRFLAEVKITKEYEQGDVRLECDPDKLKQVFTNIMNNAVQVMKGKGDITIKMREDNRNVIIAISDTGPGIRPEIVKKIFTPFESHKHKGIGLGLSIANKIVQMHAGRIEVDTKQGVGTTFRVILPIEQK